MLPENQAKSLIPYASKADPEYVNPIPTEQQEKGVVPLDSLPAQYWNWLWNTLTTQHNLSVLTVTSILKELQNILTLAGITPDAADEGQLAAAIKKLTTDVIGQFSDLKFESDDVKTVVDALNALYDTIKDDIDKRLKAIEDVIPSAASATNKLTDEAFVLRHVATNTANFRGEWPNWEDVPEEGDQYPIDYAGNHNPTENDYMVVRDMSDYQTGNEVTVPSHWEAKDWGENAPNNGKFIWHDNEGNIYYNASLQFAGGIWVTKDWGTNMPYGPNIWHDSEGNTYCDKYKLVDGQWIQQNWSNLPVGFSGGDIWHDASGNTYYSFLEHQLQFIDGQWVIKDWGEMAPYHGAQIWNDNNGNTYYSEGGSAQWKLADGQWADDSSLPSYVIGQDIWRDAFGNIYCSNYQFINGQWSPANWTTSILGQCVWNDSEGNPYYSNGEVQLQFIPSRQEAYFKGAWQFKYTGDWTTKGKSGWEPEFNLGSIVDYDLLDERYALKTTVEDVESKIPAAASAVNQLADKKWVEESSGLNWEGTPEEFEAALEITDKNAPGYIKDKTGLDIFKWEQESWFPISSKVQLGDLNAVTSDAVAKAFELDWGNKVPVSSFPWTATGRGLFYVRLNDVGSDGIQSITVNGQIISFIDGSAGITNMGSHVIIAKDDVVNVASRYQDAVFIPYKIQF